MSLLATITIKVRYEDAGVRRSQFSEIRALLVESITDAIGEDPSILDPGDLMLTDDEIEILVDLKESGR